MPTPSRSAATAADLLALPEDERFHEVIGGELVRKADPSGEHGGTQADLAGWLSASGFARSGKGDGLRGWWFATEVEIELAVHEVYRPDVLGWGKERVPERPRGSPVRIRPDWICEILSPRTARNDRGRKLEGCHRAGVPHYWLVDPIEETLTVHRWSADGYLVVLTAERGQCVRAEPFEAVGLAVGALFGDDPLSP